MIFNMEISYLGHSSFRIKGKLAVLVTDPFDAYVGFKFPKVEADIVLVSHDHQDHNQKELVEGNPYVIEGPGEYEVKGVSVLGLATYHDEVAGEKRGKNTVYRIELEGMSLCHLGDLGHSLSSAQLGEVNGVDVLFVPVGGLYTIGPKRAVEVIGQIEPKIVIPMHYRVAEQKGNETFAGLSTVEDFLKEIGEEATPQPKLLISRDRLPLEREVVVLERKK
jgi:L-ascorbate metabolism protein UlaG (beta-lactamase superfamily)